MTTMDYNYHLKKALDAGSEATKAHESGDLWSAAEHNKTMLHHLGELRKIKHKIPPPALSALAHLTSLGSHLTEALAGLDARSLNPNVTTEKFTDVTDTASIAMATNHLIENAAARYEPHKAFTDAADHVLRRPVAHRDGEEKPIVHEDMHEKMNKVGSARGNHHWLHVHNIGHGTRIGKDAAHEHHLAKHDELHALATKHGFIRSHPEGASYHHPDTGAHLTIKKPNKQYYTDTYTGYTLKHGTSAGKPHTTASTSMNRTERNLASLVPGSSEAMEESLSKGRAIHNDAKLPHAQMPESANTEEAAQIEGTEHLEPGKNWAAHKKITNPKWHKQQGAYHTRMSRKLINAAQSAPNERSAHKMIQAGERHHDWANKHLDFAHSVTTPNRRRRTTTAHTEEAALITGRNWNEHAQVTDHKHHMVEAGKHLAAYNKAVAAHKAATKSGQREQANKANDRAQRHLGWNRKHLATARELYHKVAASLEAGSEETSAVSALGQAHTIVQDNTKADVHGGDAHPNPAKRTSTRYHLSDTDAERAVADLKKAGFRPHPKPASGVLHHFVKGNAHVKIDHPDTRDSHHIISVHS